MKTILEYLVNNHINRYKKLELSDFCNMFNGSTNNMDCIKHCEVASISVEMFNKSGKKFANKTIALLIYTDDDYNINHPGMVFVWNNGNPEKIKEVFLKFKESVENKKSITDLHWHYRAFMDKDHVKYLGNEISFATPPYYDESIYLITDEDYTEIEIDNIF